jgi:hypothetical protein
MFGCGFSGEARLGGQTFFGSVFKKDVLPALIGVDFRRQRSSFSCQADAAG